MSIAHFTHRYTVRATALVSAGLLACAGLSACSSDSPSSGSNAGSPQGSAEQTSSGPRPTMEAPAGLEGFYNQELEWYPCTSEDGIEKASGKAKFSCAVAEVPLDYDQPDGDTITIAMKKREASGSRQGTLFINPGGPGGSGVDFISSLEGYFSQTLIDAYDVIGFDPRGVGSSTAVDCLTDAEVDKERSGDTPYEEAADDATAQAEVVKDTEEREAKCEQNTQTPGLLDHIDTISVARDLDVLRAATGNETLDYLGFSYGTYLGATYAGLFPEKVDRMVLDGAVDPSLSAADLTRGQAKGFEDALHAYVEDCLGASSCPLSGTVDDGVKQIQDFLTSTKTRPVPTSEQDRPLTYALASAAVLDLMYQSEGWDVLSQGLEQAMQEDDGSILLYIADVFASRNDDGSYSGNGDEVIGAINCLDYPVSGDAATWAQEAEELKTLSPTFGADLGYSDLACQAWGHESTREREEIHAAGAPPILVVGTTGDPATPYEWSQSLASQLDSGVLVTWEGDGHTAYGRAGRCITEAVDGYLVDGTVPKEGLTCTGQK